MTAPELGKSVTCPWACLPAHAGTAHCVVNAVSACPILLPLAWPIRVQKPRPAGLRQPVPRASSCPDRMTPLCRHMPCALITARPPAKGATCFHLPPPPAPTLASMFAPCPSGMGPASHMHHQMGPRAQGALLIMNALPYRMLPRQGHLGGLFDDFSPVNPVLSSRPFPVLMAQVDRHWVGDRQCQAPQFPRSSRSARHHGAPMLRVSDCTQLPCPLPSCSHHI